MPTADLIHARNLDAYLRYLGETLGRDAAPAGGATVWKGLSPEALTEALSAHYRALGIPTVRGYKYERAFLKTHTEEDWESEMATPLEPKPSADFGTTEYGKISPAIGADNYKAYLQWIEKKTNSRLLPGTIASWTFMDGPAIRVALPGLYAAMGISPAEASNLEASFWQQSDHASRAVRNVQSEAPVSVGSPIQSKLSVPSDIKALQDSIAADFAKPKAISVTSAPPSTPTLAMRPATAFPSSPPSSLKSRIEREIKFARKSQKGDTLRSLQALLEAVMAASASGTFTEADELQLLQAKAEEHRSSHSAGKSRGDYEWVNRAQKELAIIDRFLPQKSTEGSSATPTPPSPVRFNGPVRRTRRRLIALAVLLPIATAGGWVGVRYQTWAALPTVYPLTDNVALRTQPYDKAGDAGRMDLFARYVEKGVGGVKQSVARLKLLSEEPENGFYRATKNPSFLAWLKGDEEAVYVHTKYTTPDRALFEQHQRVLAPLRDDLNGLDKLTSAYRRLLVDAFTKSPELQGLALAQPCRTSAAISTTAAVPVGTYRNKSTGEIYAVVFTADGRCFAINGLEAEGSGVPTVRPVQTEWGALLTGPGSFKRGNGGTLRYVPCEEEAGEELTGKPPYTMFKQPPSILPPLDSIVDQIFAPSVVDTIPSAGASGF